MIGKIVLDTSVIVEALAGDPVTLAAIGRAQEALVPVIAFGELLHGAENSGQRDVEAARVEAFVAVRGVLPCTPEAGRLYGEIKHRLRRKGRPIPDNDLWIAAIARHNGMTLATRDAHFREVEELPLLEW